MHGFSLNVFPDLAVFNRINPCGLPGCPVTAMAVEGKQPPSERRVVLQLKNDFEPLLNKWLPIS
jgi:lipoyl(octanoyl) transferase